MVDYIFLRKNKIVKKQAQIFQNIEIFQSLRIFMQVIKISFSISFGFSKYAITIP
jgi:hypothetical protein